MFTLALMSVTGLLLQIPLRAQGPEVRGGKPHRIATAAGGGTLSDSGSALEVRLSLPSRVVVDSEENVYISDAANHIVRKLESRTGLLRIIAGTGVPGYSGDGDVSTNASLGEPSGLAVTPSGDLYIADSAYHVIRKVSARTSIITTVAGMGTAGASGDGGPAVKAQLNQPHGLALDNLGNLYVADTWNHKIRRIDHDTGTISTIAGNGVPGYSGDNGTATRASLFAPAGIALDQIGQIYIADTNNNRVRVLEPLTLVITTYAGDGTPGFSGDGGDAYEAKLRAPADLSIDVDGGLYVADQDNHRIRRVAAESHRITTIAGDGQSDYQGDGGEPVQASLNRPSGIFAALNGNLYIADRDNNRVRFIVPGELSSQAREPVTKLDGATGVRSAATVTQTIDFPIPAGFVYGMTSVPLVASSSSGLSVSFESNNAAVCTVSASRLTVVDVGTCSVTASQPGDSTFLPANSSTRIFEIGKRPQFPVPNRVYGQWNDFASNTSNNGGITRNTLYRPDGVASDPLGGVYVADTFNNRVLHYPAGSTTADRVYGQQMFHLNTQNYGGVGPSSLVNPNGLAVDTEGGLYVADYGNNRVLHYPPGSQSADRAYGQPDLYSNAGNNGGISANSLYGPIGVAVDASGLYVADYFNHRVLHYPIGSTTADRVYGQPSFTANISNNGGVTANSLFNPYGVAVDSSGQLFIADYGNHRVLHYPIANTTADRVYGQPSFLVAAPNNFGYGSNNLGLPTGVAVDAEAGLYIVDGWNNRVLHYTGASTTADYVYVGAGGQVPSNTLSPIAVSIDSSGHLYVADVNHRVLYFGESITPLAVSVGQSVISYGGTTTVITTGGAGDGPLTYGTYGGCDITGSTLRASSVGTCEVFASKAQDDHHLGATSFFATTITVTPASQESLTARVSPSTIPYRTTATLWTTGGSGYGPVSFSVTNGSNNCSIDNVTAKVTGIGVGTCTITATKATDGTYLAITSAPITITVTGEQIITFPQPAGFVFGVGPQPLVAASSSGLEVMLESTTPTVCTMSGKALTAVGVGTCSIIATQGGSGAILAAAIVIRAFEIGKRPQSAIASRVYGQLNDFTSGANNNGGVTANSLNYPGSVAIDVQGGIYVADSGNNRVLHYSAGSRTADRVYGQPDLSSNAFNNGHPSKMLSWPNSVAVEARGGLYVSDSGNNRVLHFPVGSSTADLVFGQPDFYSYDRNHGGLKEDSLAGPAGVALDTQGGVYIVDRENHRVLHYPPGAVVGDRVYGQPNMISNAPNNGGVSASSLSSPAAVVVDGDGGIYIADHGNARVLHYPNGSTVADRVYGQANLVSIGTATMEPLGLALDSAGGIYVADRYGNRLLHYQAGSNIADRSLGQAPIEGINASSLAPSGLAVDPSGGIYAADIISSRIVYYSEFVAPLTLSSVSTSVAVGLTTNLNTTGGAGTGAVTFVTVTNGECSINGSTLTAMSVGTCPVTAIKDEDSNYLSAYSSTIFITVVPGAQAALILQSTPSLIGYGSGSTLSTTGGSGYGAVSFTVTSGVSYCSLDAGVFFGTRVTAIGVGMCTITATKAADGNYLEVTSDPISITVVPAEQTISFQTPSAIVYGMGPQPLGARSSSGLTVQFESTTPAVCSVSGGALRALMPGTCAIIASQPGSVLFLPAASVTQSFDVGRRPQYATANRVYGQYSNGLGLSASSLYSPAGLVIDAAGGAYIADQGNNRVLHYPAGAATADRVYGQPNFSSSGINNGGLGASSLNAPSGVAVEANGGIYIADQSNHRVLHFSSGATTADRVYGQPNFTSNAGSVGASSLYRPQSVAIDSAGGIYVADTGNSRILHFPVGSTTADRVYGQPNFTSNLYNNGGLSATALYQPSNVALGPAGDLYVADVFNNRVLHYSGLSTIADRVYGQPDFASFVPNNGGVKRDTLNTPAGLVVDSRGGLYLVDGNNHRVLHYPAGSVGADQVYGQQTFTGNSIGSTANSLNVPSAVGLDGSGAVYISDRGNSRVLYFDSYPTPLEINVSQLTLTVGATSALSTTGGAGTGAVSYQVVTGGVNCSISGTTLTGTAAGSCTVAATKASDTNYLSATSPVVTITVTAPSQATIPNVVGLTQVQAATALTNSGLAVGTVTTSTSASVAAGTVMSTNPVAGTVVSSGTAVNLVISGPQLTGATPASGNGASQTFVFTFSQSGGYTNLNVVNVLINNAIDGRQACYLAYVISTNTLYLVNDAGDGGGPFAGGMVLNGSGSVSNSQCTIQGSGSSAVGLGNTLTLSLNTTFSAGFGGNKVLYTAARDTGNNNTGWQAAGVWKAPATSPTGPAVGGVNPAKSTATTQTFSFIFTDTNGWQDISVANVLINSAIDGRNACYIALVPSSATSGAVYLVDDAGNAGGPYAGISLPGSGTAANSQCSIAAAGSSFAGNGNTLTVNLAITFGQNFNGNRIIYPAVRNGLGVNSGWQAVGTISR